MNTVAARIRKLRALERGISRNDGCTCELYGWCHACRAIAAIREQIARLTSTQNVEKATVSKKAA